MYRLAEIEDIDQIAELRILQQKELFKKIIKLMMKNSIIIQKYFY